CGGKCGRAVPTYTHTSGGTFAEVTQAVRRAIDRGYRYVRAQVAIPGMATYGSGGAVGTAPRGAAGTSADARTQLWEPRKYVTTVLMLFEHLRKEVGDEVELLHDCNERILPIPAMQPGVSREPY